MTIPGILIMVGLFALGIFTGWRLAAINHRLDALISQAPEYRKVPDHVPADWAYDEWWKK